MKNPFGKHQYYYVVTKINGKIVVWLKENWKSETDANQAAFNALKGRTFQVVAKPYKDVGRVTQEAKALHLEDSGDLEGSIQRAVHQPGRLKIDTKVSKDI